MLYGTPIICSAEHSSYRSSGTYDFDMAARFLETLCTPTLTNYVAHISSWHPESSTANQEIHRILLNPKTDNCQQPGKYPYPKPDESSPNHLVIILIFFLSTPRYFRYSFSFRFSNENSVHIWSLIQAVTSPAHLTHFYSFAPITFTFCALIPKV